VGLALLINTNQNITGAVIGTNMPYTLDSILGFTFIFLSGIVLKRKKLKGGLEKKIVEIGSLKYDAHALERMEKRRLYPSVIQDAIENGEHHELKHVKNHGETKGATQAYIKRHSASVIKGEGKRRIIKIKPGEKRYQNIVALTNDKGIVKTVYVGNDYRLKQFTRKYLTSKSKK